MSVNYVPSDERRIDLAAASIGGICVLLVFSLLPLLHVMPSFIAPPPTIDTEGLAEPLPTFVEPPVNEEIIKQKEIEKPILDTPPKAIDPRTLESLLNPGTNGVKVDVGLGGIGQTVEDAARVFLTFQVDKKPFALVPAKPQYPYDLRGRRGEVTLEFIIGANGSPRAIRAKSSSNWKFETPAIESVRRTKWQPGEKDGKPVDTQVSLTINFTP